MAGILGFLGLDPAQGGILGNQAAAPMTWQNKLGIISAGLADAGASLNGRPTDNLDSFRRYQMQNQLRQAYQTAATASDPASRQQAYSMILANGGDPTALQNNQANAAYPQLMQNMQPMSVAVTPAANSTNPAAAAQRAAAQQINASPDLQTTPTLQQAAALTGVPELSQRIDPMLLQGQIAAQTKLAEPYTLQPGESRFVGNTRIAGAPALPKIAPNGVAYDPSSLQPGTTFNDPNKPFGADGSPNKAVQDFELRKATAGTRLRLESVLGAPGADQTQNPVVQSYVQNILGGNMNMQNVPQQLRGAVSVAMQSTAKGQFAPIAGTRYTQEASRITKPYTDQSGYKLTADAVPYLKRIDAAMKTPGSVSDQDLLDSLTKLNTGGNAVTDAQVKLITDGKSLSDWAGTIKNKVKNGGVLSDNQRQQIHEIANNIYQGYRETYQPIYERASAQLTAAGIPKQFWTIPDLNDLGNAQMAAGNPAPTPTPAPHTLPQKNKTIRFEDLP